MRRIQNRITNVGLSACQTDVLVRVGMLVMRLRIGQMRVIVVLMHNYHRRRAINHGPFLLVRSEDHPVVPARATDGEVGNIFITRFWEKKKIASCRTMKLSLRSESCFQSTLPAFGEFDRLSDIQVPTPTQ